MRYFIVVVVAVVSIAYASNDNIDVEKYFPSKKLNNKTLVYNVKQAPMDKYYDTLEFDNNCVKVNRKYPNFSYYDNNNSKKIVKDSGYFFNYCLDKSKENITETNTNTVLLNKNGVWNTVAKSLTDGKKINVKCKVVKKYTDTVANKEYKLLETSCGYKIKDFNVELYYILAQGIGIVEEGTILEVGKKISHIKLNTIK